MREESLREFCEEVFDKLMSIFFAETLEEEAYMLELYERARQFGIIREP